MPASENGMNNSLWLTSDNQLDNGGKMHMTHLEKFS